MKKQAVILTAFGILSLSLAQSAYAIDMEYYTYGGFGPITQAFTRLALIFSDAGYLGLFAVVMVLGILAGAISWSVQAANGGRMTPLVWAVPVIFGAAIYLGLFVPKGNITVYDPVLNRFQTIGGIPDAVVFTAGALSKIERGLVDIIDTAGAPDAQYAKGAGGVGFKTLESVRGSYIKDNHLRTSTIKYVKDCVTFELMRPGTSLSLDTLRNDTTDFLSELGQAVNPAIYTVYYDSANPSGVTKTCTEAWNLLRPLYQSPANYDEALKKACGKASFDSSNSNEFTTCKNLISSTLNFTTGTAVSPDKLVQQRQISEILYTFYYQDDVETAMLMEANRKITASGIGAGIAMNEWIPIIKAIMTAIAIGMIPFLALFLPTPVVGKALSAMFGFFCFLTIWGITDAVIHNAAMDYAVYAFEDVRQSSLGVYAMAAFPDLSTKMLAMFGVIRSSGIMLASLFTMMLIKFGGHALAMMAGSLSSAVSGAGSSAGALLTPEGTSAAMNQQVNAAGLLQGLPQHKFSNMAAAGAYKVHSNVGGYNAEINARENLQHTGQIPHGTSDKDFAQMVKSSNVSVGTAGGQASMTMGPDGQAVMAGNKSVDSQGFTGQATTGDGGQGQKVLTGAAGRQIRNLDGQGGSGLTQASVNNLNPIALASQAVHMKTEGAGHSLVTSKGWDNIKSQMKQDAYTSQEARSYADKLSNAEASEWSRAINDKSGFTKSLDATTKAHLQTLSQASGGIEVFGTGATASGQIMASATGTDGKKLSFTVDESTANAIKETENTIREWAFAQTFSDSKGMTYAANLAQRVGATEAANYMNDAREMTRATETTGVDATTQFVAWYASDRYGSNSEENIGKAINDLNHMAAGGGGHGVSPQLQQHLDRFMKSGDYTWGGTRAAVQGQIAEARRDVGRGMSNVQGAVMSGVSTVAGRTNDLDPGNFGGHPADTHEPLVGTKDEGQRTLDDAEALRDKHETKRGHGHTDVLVENLTGINIPTPDQVKELSGEINTQISSPTNDRISARERHGKPPLEGD